MKGEIRLTLIVEPDGDRGFHAYCPQLPGLHTCGDTETEALENVLNATSAYSQSLLRHSEAMPEEAMQADSANSFKWVPMKPKNVK